jgi:hypothetical protein
MRWQCSPSGINGRLGQYRARQRADRDAPAVDRYVNGTGRPAGDRRLRADYRPPCPCCGGRMIIVETFGPGGAPRAPPSPPTGQTRLRHCAAVAPSSPKPSLTPSIRPKSHGRPPQRRRSWHGDRRSDADHPGQHILYPSRYPIKSHRRRPPTRPPAGSFPGGFRTPALRAPGWSPSGRHPKPFTEPDLAARFNVTKR